MRPRSALMLLPVLAPVLAVGLAVAPGSPAIAAGPPMAAAAGPPPAIAGGEDVVVGRYAFAVKLTMTDLPVAGGGTRDSSCTGALIAPRWVITAGHCFRSLQGAHVSRLVARTTTATVGRTDLSSTAGHKVKVVAVRQSPTTDVALAKLDKPVTDITPARLNRTAPAIGTVVRLAGFGRTVDDDASSLATHLQTGQFKIVSRSQGYVGMTGRSPRRTTSPCKNDSGGPYFTQQGSAPAVLISVVSRGPSCPHKQVDLSGRIDPIVGWITGVVGRAALNPAPPAKPSGKPSARPSATATAGRDDQARGPAAGPGSDPAPVVRTALAAAVVVGFGAVPVFMLGNRRRRSRQRSGVRRHRR